MVSFKYTGLSWSLALSVVGAAAPVQGKAQLWFQPFNNQLQKMSHRPVGASFFWNTVRPTRRQASNASLHDTLEASLARFPSRLTRLPYGAELPSFVCEHERKRPICTTAIRVAERAFCARWLHLQTLTLEFHPNTRAPTQLGIILCTI